MDLDELFDDVIAAWSDFLSQPFGVVGAFCIMAAVTTINSRWLAARLAEWPALSRRLFNGLNLVGGVALFVNAVIRSEVVWLVLEVYFVAVAVKGLADRDKETADDGDAERWAQEAAWISLTSAMHSSSPCATEADSATSVSP